MTILRQHPDPADAHNEPADDWRPVASVWASVTPLSARETVQAYQQGGLIQYRVVLRAGGAARTLTHQDRLLWRGRTLFLEQPTLDVRQDVWTSLAREALP